MVKPRLPRYYSVEKYDLWFSNHFSLEVLAPIWIGSPSEWHGNQEGGLLLASSSSLFLLFSPFPSVVAA